MVSTKTIRVNVWYFFEPIDLADKLNVYKKWLLGSYINLIGLWKHLGNRQPLYVCNVIGRE